MTAGPRAVIASEALSLESDAKLSADRSRPALKRVPANANGATGECTDLRNAERLVEIDGPDLRYVVQWAKWIAFDGTRWETDPLGAQRAAQATSRRIMAEALAGMAAANEALADAAQANDRDGVSEAKADRKEAEKALEWAVTSQGSARLAAMLDVARADARVAVRVEALDADPWLFNVTNGTIDLRTGELRDHRREDLVTLRAPVAFDREAACPTWDRFLDRAMAGNDALVSFLRRSIGYALTGETREHVLGFFFGGGQNGKSTFLTIVHDLLGDYAAPAPRGLIFRARGERHPTELASLHGKRFVTCSEIEEGQAFDEALVKDLTGGDPIRCRRMREDFWTFKPTHKLFIAGNHKPTVRGTDDGIWRRLRLVPWTVTIPPEERDRHLVDKLRAELPGILAWAVRGCLEWQRDGLGEPPEVTGATAKYREESDVLGDFLRTRCVMHADQRCTRKSLRETYEEWAKENGHIAMGAKPFTSGLRDRGVSNTTVRVGDKVKDGWRGIRLKSTEERAIEAAEGA